MAVPEPIDATGTIVVELRSASILAALAGMTGGDSDEGRVGARRSDVAAPAIIVERLVSTLLPYGPGSGRLGMKGYTYAIKCVAKRGPKGDVEATHLADVVAHFLHNRGPRSRSYSLGKVGIHISRVPTVTNVLEDPVSGEPFVVVNATVDAGAHALT